MLDKTRLTESELVLYDKLTSQKKPLKEKQKQDLEFLKKKMCDCRCHVENVIDFHWFETCC